VKMILSDGVDRPCWQCMDALK